MHFAPDTVASLEFTVALCNTVPSASKSGLDELSTPAQLTELLDAHGYTGRFDRDLDELYEVQIDRAVFRALWSMSVDDAVEEVNRMLADARALPHLAQHDHFPWHLHATERYAPLAERIRVETALALVDVIRDRQTDRLRVCEAEDCDGLLLDLSRNGSKRFCSVRCGNRVNQLAFRSRG